MGVWPVGYFRAFSGWVLNNRRGVAARVATINAEVSRIGFIKVFYQGLDSAGSTERSEDRLGISVTAGSTLERLVQAYVAQGGNPLDISSFMHPQSTDIDVDDEGNTVSVSQYPFDGLIAPRSAEPNEPYVSATDTGYGAFPGGMPRTHRYFPARQGGRISPGSYDYNAVVKSMHQIRDWTNQDIKERLSDLEARIIKQCDLREQLVHERDVVLVQAFGGALFGVAPLDEERFDKNLMVQNMIRDMEGLIYKVDDLGDIIAPRMRDDAYLAFVLPDVPEDFMVELGI